MTARVRMLAAIAALHTELAAVAEQASQEGDHWVGLTASMVRQAVDRAAIAADEERRARGEK